MIAGTGPVEDGIRLQSAMHYLLQCWKVSDFVLNLAESRLSGGLVNFIPRRMNDDKRLSSLASINGHTRSDVRGGGGRWTGGGNGAR